MLLVTPEDRIKACADRHPDWPAKRIAKSLGLRMAEVEAVKAGGPGGIGHEQPGDNPIVAPAPGPGSLIALDRVISRYDTRAAILRVVGELPKGKLILEAELCAKAAGTDRNRFRRACDNNADEFKPLRIKLRLDDSAEGKWYWGHASDIAEAQRIVAL